MAQYQPLVNVNITNLTRPITQPAFGTMIFIGDHPWFPEPVRVYTSDTDALADVPSNSLEAAAIRSAYSGVRRPDQIMIGRRSIDSILLSPNPVTGIGITYSLTVVGTDDLPITASFVTTTGVETQAEIVTSLFTDLGTITGVTLTDNTGTLSIAKSTTEDFWLTSITGFTYQVSTTVTAQEALDNIREVNDDFYVVTASDHSAAFVASMRAAINGTSKQYHTSTQDITALGVYSEAGTDIGSVHRTSGALRAWMYFKEDADTTFPECEYVQWLLTFTPGTSILEANPVNSGSARNPTTLRFLTGTEKTNLAAKNISFVEPIGGQNVIRLGFSATGERAAFVRNLDYAMARITVVYQSFFINNPIVTFDKIDIARLKAVVTNELDRYVTAPGLPNILASENSYSVNFPPRSAFSANDIALGAYAATFTGNLAGAITNFRLDGTLTFIP